MRRATTIALVVGLLLTLSAGAALAAFIDCPGGLCRGTNNEDTMLGAPVSDEMHALAGDDYLSGLDGDDYLSGDDGDDYLSEGDGDGTLIGGLGNDEMSGDNGAHEFFGDDGDDRIDAQDNLFFNESGVDTASGGPGNDVIAGNDGFADHIDCGTGSRDIAYFDDSRLDSVNSDCEWRNPYPEERMSCGLPWVPELGNKPLWCIDGTTGDDELAGTVDPSVIDSIWGDAGNDTLRGLKGGDGLAGWSGDDTLYGGEGTDWLFGDDSGHPNQDEPPPDLVSGNDNYYGGPGNDFIGAIDGKRDMISCGSGRDSVQADKDIDAVAKNCEKVRNFAEDKYHWFRKTGRRR